MDNNFTLDQQGESLARRKKVIDAMIEQQMAVDAKGGTGGALEVLNNYFGKKRTSEQAAALEADSSKYRDAYGKQLGRETEQYLDTSQGSPGHTLPPELAGPVTPEVAPNPREAIIRAMTSRLPEMQALGKENFKHIGKGEEWKDHVVGDTVVQTNSSGKSRVVGTYNKADWVDEAKTIEGKSISGQKNTKTGEWKPFSPSGQTINIGEKGDMALLEPGMKILDKTRTAILASQKDLSTAERIYQLSQDPQLITGPGANALTTLSVIGAKLGLNGPEAAAKTQAMMTDLASNALAKGQAMKGSFSDADIKFLEKASAGSIELTPDVMRQVAALAYAASHNDILANSKQYGGTASSTEALRKASGMYPMPTINHKNLDPKLFQDEEATGYMKYNSPLTGQVPAAGGKKRMSSAEFLGD